MYVPTIKVWKLLWQSLKNGTSCSVDNWIPNEISGPKWQLFTRLLARHENVVKNGSKVKKFYFGEMIDE
jgi:hypothetical protein